jgi:phosphatidylserine/phosphatidylglycerophosphate/cardiolipin synthase-like enzyme
LKRIVLLMVSLSFPMNFGGCGSTPSASIASDCACSITVYQGHDKEAPQDLVRMMRETNTTSNNQLRFAVYSLTDPSLVNEVLAAKQRGVNVRGIVDKSQTANEHMLAQVQRLVDGNVPLKWGDSRGLMHLKLLVTETDYASGSLNWTRAARTVNDEVLEVGKNCEPVRSQYEKIWEEVYEKNSFVDLKNLAVEKDKQPRYKKRI